MNNEFKIQENLLELNKAKQTKSHVEIKSNNRYQTRLIKRKYLGEEGRKETFSKPDEKSASDHSTTLDANTQ